MFLVLSLCIFALVGGCSKKDNTSKSTTPKTTVTPAPTTAAKANTAVTIPKKADYDLSKYITLGKYKGIEVTVKKLTVTDADINKQIDTDLSNNATNVEVKGRAVKKGDIVNIDYEGLKGGVAFQGGTAKGTDLTIGSGQFIPGFEDKLIGDKVGDKVKIDLTFPADYQAKDLAGQAVVFNVTINKISEKVTPKIADYVKSKTNFKTVAAYKQNVKATLEKTNESTMLDTKKNDVITAIVKDSKISSVPKTLTDYYSAEFENYYNQYASMMGTDLDTLLSQQGLTKEDFASRVTSYAQNRSTYELVIKSIIKAENMKLSDKEYKDGVAKVLKDNGFKTEADLYKQTPKDEVAEQLLWDKALNFVTTQAIEK